MQPANKSKNPETHSQYVFQGFFSCRGRIRTSTGQLAKAQC